MKSLTSKAVPPDRRPPNQLHGWLAKSALNSTPHPTFPEIFFSLLFSFQGASHLFYCHFRPSFCLPLLFSPFILALLVQTKKTVNKVEQEEGGGSETREAGMNRMSGVSLSRIRKQRMRDWVDGEMS